MLNEIIMKFLLHIISLLGAIKVFFRSTVRNSESVFLTSGLLNLLKTNGITINDSIISIEGKKIIFSTKKNNGIESIKVDLIGTKIKIYENENFAYVAIRYSNLLRQLFVQKRHYEYLCLISILFRNKDDIHYLRDSIKTCNFYINLVKKEFLLKKELNDDLKFDSWFLQNIQYSFNNKSEKNHLIFKNLFILKSSLGFRENTNSNKKRYSDKELVEVYNSKKLDFVRKVPRKVLIFYIDNISYFTANNEYLEEKNYPIFAKLLKDHNLNNLKFTSTTDWTFPAAISFFSGKSYNQHMISHRNHKPYFSINNLLSNAISNESNDIRKLKAIFQSRVICGSNWRMHQHHGLVNIFNHLMTNPIYTDVYDVICQAYKQIDITEEQNSFHWINLMDAHHPIKDSILPYGALKSLNINSIKHGLQYETGPKFDKNLTNKNLPRNIYYSQLESVAKAIDKILNYSYEKCNPEEHLILFISDHGSSFCPINNQYNNILEKHTPMLSISSNYLNPKVFNDIKNKRFSHFGFFKLLHHLVTSNLDRIPEDCYSNYSQIIFPYKEYEFFYFDDFNQVIYSFKSSNKLPKEIFNFSNTKIKNKFIDIMVKGNWKSLKKEGEHILKKDQVPPYVINVFNESLPLING